MGTRIVFFMSVSVGMTVAASPNVIWNPYIKRDIPSPNRYNYFDAELLEVLVRHEDGNVLVSPLAVKIALEMLMDGAVGRSAEEIRIALRLNQDSSNRKELPSRLSSLQVAGDASTLKIATSLFVADRSQIHPEYRTAMKNLGFDITKVRFQYPREVADTINKWVTNSTLGMITKLVDEEGIDPQSLLSLVNAMYFKGEWLRPFAKKNTKTMCFRTGNNCVEVPMMTDTNSYEYAYIPKLDADAINIPYKGNRFSFLMVLPKKNDCRQLSRDMLHISLEEIMSELLEQEVHVRIPKFTVESKGNLRPHLQKMSILQVFGPHAELKGMFSGQRDTASVNQFLYATKMEVYEEGTEAAATIGSLFVPLMGGPPTSFIADHPFLFFVRDMLTGAVLFSGKMERPDGDLNMKGYFKTPNPAQITPRRSDVHSLDNHHPDGRQSLLSGRVLTIEVEKSRYPGRQLSPPLLHKGVDRHHATLETVKKGNHGRTGFLPDAISFGY